MSSWPHLQQRRCGHFYPRLVALIPAITLLTSLFIVAYPLFDPDLYWHLANGRTMVSTRHVVNEEIFSYTHAGEHFVNHEWLSQIVFYLLWHHTGIWGLYAAKAALTSVVVYLVYRTARDRCHRVACAGVLTVLCILAGIQRYHVRPELYSLVGVAVVAYLLHNYQVPRISRHLPWMMPTIFLLWDSLHGAIVGVVLLLVFVLAENIKHRHWALRGPRQAATSDGRPGLNVTVTVTVLAMLLNPYGLRSYEHFRILGAGEYGSNTILELQPMWTAAWSHVPFLLMLMLAIVTLLAKKPRRADLTDILLAVVFGGAALRYNRLSGMAAIILAPIIAGQLAALLEGGKPSSRRLYRWLVACTMAVIACVIAKEKIINMSGSVSPTGAYLLPSPVAFGLSINEKMTPAGSTRFIVDKGLAGNMYNNANLAGYLCYYLAPERPIFQYNMPPIFGDTTRFVKHPSELEKWHVDYALAGSPGELTRLFPPERWAWIYSDYVSTLVVRRTPEHKALIDTYEIQYFAPEQPELQYKQISNNPRARSRMAFEMGVYLAYMSDVRIAKRWQELLGTYPDLMQSVAMKNLLARAAIHNKALSSLSRPDQ